MADPIEILERALQDTRDALTTGDGAAAAEASGRAALACAELEAAGARLEPAQLARLAELQAACEASAGQSLARLGVELDAAARSSRAATAYRR